MTAKEETDPDGCAPAYSPHLLRWLRHFRHRHERHKARIRRSFKRRVEYLSRYAVKRTSMAEARAYLRDEKREK